MKRPSHRGSEPEYRQADHLDELIDEAGEESFPASDAPAVTPRRGLQPSPAEHSTGDPPRERSD